MNFFCANPLGNKVKKCKIFALYFVLGKGNKVKKCKIFALYFVLGNLPRKKRSMLDSINLAILCKTIFIEKYGYESVQ